MNQPLQTCPFESLRALVEQDDTQRALSMVRRVERKGAEVFSDESLAAVEDPAVARIYHMNISNIVYNLQRNENRFRDRHGETNDIVKSLEQEVFPGVKDELDAEGEIPKIYMYTYPLGEARELGREAAADGQKFNERFLGSLGLDNTYVARPSSLFITIEKAWSAVKEHGGFQVPLGLRHTSDLRLYLSEMTGSATFNARILGVGDYGEGFTDSIFTAHAAFAAAIERSIDTFKRWDENNPGMSKRLSRSVDIHRQATKQSTVAQMSMHEGSLSIAQTISVLTNDKLNGYPNPYNLVKDIIEKGALNEFAKKMPYAGIIGPLAMAGLTFDPLLKRGPDGEPIIDPLTIQVFAAARRAVREKELIATERIGDYERGEQFLAYAGCPATYSTNKGDKSLVQTMASAFLGHLQP